MAAAAAAAAAAPASAPAQFRALVSAAAAARRPLQILGAVNAYCGLIAEKAGAFGHTELRRCVVALTPLRAGASCLYLSGSGVATASHGLPDLGITDLHDVLEDSRRLVSVCKAPLLVDIDTGFGSAFNIARTVRELERAGVAAVHIEDQEGAKRCGHRPGKQIVSTEEMVDRIRTAVDARSAGPNGLVIMARTDALANEGLDGAIKRMRAYVSAGADMLFPEAFTELEQYKTLARELPGVPFLANITEFGKTPLYTTTQLADAGVAMVLYPLSAHRAMAKAAQKVYTAILRDGTQSAVVADMQTRDELYEMIDYYRYEQTLDRLFGADGGKAKKTK
jgi:methylisocitrate lyase